MTDLFTPPYPRPPRSKRGLVKRFLRGWHSWIHVLFDKSYTMKMGEIRLPGRTMYIANELPLVDTILRGGTAYPKHSELVRNLDPLIGNSVFSANGADWESQRAMVNPAFAHTALGRSMPLMVAAVDDLVARIAAAVASTSSPSSSPETRVSPTAIAPRIRERWLIDLSPGTVMLPRKGPAGRKRWEAAVSFMRGRL